VTRYVHPPRRPRPGWDRPSLAELVARQAVIVLVYLVAGLVVAVGLWASVALTILFLTPHP
jgi:hypothetical protein